jgi:hypothetical protein
MLPSRHFGFCIAVGISLLILIDCRFGRGQYTLRGDSRVQHRVLYDSADVRSLAEQATEVERRLRQGRQSPGDSIYSRPGKAFRKVREEMDKQRGYDVPGGISFKILFELPNLFYSKAQFTDGSFKGQIGWVSKGSFNDPRNGMP